jgi:hypothetical protein
MFNWEKLEAMGIGKANKHLIDSQDGIHCEKCGEHLSQHGARKGEILHPLDIANLINPDKE